MNAPTQPLSPAGWKETEPSDKRAAGRGWRVMLAIERTRNLAEPDRERGHDAAS